MTPTLDVSVVIPLLNEEESLGELVERIHDELNQNFTYQIILVDDGSTDRSWEVISELSTQYEGVEGIRLKRNHGKSAALQVGFDHVQGEFVITMDADLQDDPAELPKLIDGLKSGYDLISGWKKKRYDPISKTIPSKFFNYVTSKATGIKLHDFNCGLKAYKREVIDSIEVYGELHRYIPLLAYEEGFTKIGEQVVTHHARKYGISKFGLSRFINGFLDLVSILFVLRYFQRPMHFFGTIGTVSTFAGLGIVGYLSLARLFMNEYLSNRPLLIIGVMLLLLGAQLFTVGLIGELIIKQNGAKRASIKEKVS